jgi:hypothetical protein
MSGDRPHQVMPRAYLVMLTCREVHHVQDQQTECTPYHVIPGIDMLCTLHERVVWCPLHEQVFAGMCSVALASFMAFKMRHTVSTRSPFLVSYASTFHLVSLARVVHPASRQKSALSQGDHRARSGRLKS